jgi:hypothetical protein
MTNSMGAPSQRVEPLPSENEHAAAAERSASQEERAAATAEHAPNQNAWPSCL